MTMQPAAMERRAWRNGTFNTGRTIAHGSARVADGYPGMDRGLPEVLAGGARCQVGERMVSHSGIYPMMMAFACSAVMSPSR